MSDYTVTVEDGPDNSTEIVIRSPGGLAWPVSISAADEFFTVETCPFEGSAMIHLEALPAVIAALQKIQEQNS